MMRLMLEIEYQRSGLVEVYRVNEHGEPDLTPIRSYHDTLLPKRRRIAPNTYTKVKKFLANRFMAREMIDEYGAGVHFRLLLPPANIIRVREVAIKFGEWRSVCDNGHDIVQKIEVD